MLILAKDTRILSTEKVKSLKSSNSFGTNFWICADGRRIPIAELMKGYEGHRISRNYFTELGYNLVHELRNSFKKWNMLKRVMEFCDYSNSNVKCGRSSLEVEFVWGIPIPRQKIVWDSMNDVAQSGSCSIPEWVSPKRNLQVFDPAW